MLSDRGAKISPFRHMVAQSRRRELDRAQLGPGNECPNPGFSTGHARVVYHELAHTPFFCAHCSAREMKQRSVTSMSTPVRQTGIDQESVSISGSSIPDADCPSCQKPWRHTELRRAALHPALKGSPYARRTKEVRFQVCKLCDRVYSEHFESRERFTYFRFVGDNALPLLAADSSFPAIVRWMAEHSSEDGWMVEVLSSAVLKGRPQDLQPGVNALMDRLCGGVATPSNMGAWRSAALFRLLARAVVRAAKDDLRPPGNKPVRRLETSSEDLLGVARSYTQGRGPPWQRARNLHAA